jgi:hypothetical protein
MEQITMEQSAELLKVQIGGLASKMDTDNRESKAVRRADKEELMARRDAIRVGCSGSCRAGSGVFRGREGTQLL